MAREQLAWLEATLRDNPNRWTIVLQHQPVYSIARNRRTPELESRLVPLYDRYGVDLVLQGHDHVYGRTHKLRNGTVVPMDQPGAVYVVSVSGPKMYPLTLERPSIMAVTESNKQMFQVIAIDGGRLLFQAYSADGALVDRFELVKKKVPASRRF
jgi:3',5'-cyclic AMP phosphodiesterase CpdA